MDRRPGHACALSLFVLCKAPSGPSAAERDRSAPRASPDRPPVSGRPVSRARAPSAARDRRAAGNRRGPSRPLSDPARRGRPWLLQGARTSSRSKASSGTQASSAPLGQGGRPTATPRAGSRRLGRVPDRARCASLMRFRQMKPTSMCTRSERRHSENRLRSFDYCQDRLYGWNTRRAVISGSTDLASSVAMSRNLHARG